MAEFQKRHAKQIEQSGALNVARRVLFTSTQTDEGASAFDLNCFYQFGTCVVLMSRGTIYALTPSHVVRNATGNEYLNDSPFWVSRSHESFKEITDFLMPWRYFDHSPDGHGDLDVGLVEVNPLVLRGVVDYLDWDDEALFVRQDSLHSDSTAVVLGYPEEVNPWHYPESGDSPVQVAQIRRAAFRGTVSVSGSELWFENLSHREGYQYAGLSGGVVVCVVENETKYLGIVVSRDEGKKFRIVPFYEIRERTGCFESLPWEVLDEAYFFSRPTHRSMTHSELMRQLRTSADWIQPRSNAFLAQLLRSRTQRRPRSWIGDLEGLYAEIVVGLRSELISALRLVAQKKLHST